MKELPATLRSARETLGMTQSELGRAAGVSLPTVQNLEGGRANPSLSTLEAVLGGLGLGLGIETRPADWDALCALGLPLTARRTRRLVPSEDLLVGHLRLAAVEISNGKHVRDRERKLDALHALVLAIRLHYPSLFRRRLAASPLLQDIAEREVSGRVVKLCRLARASLGEYL